MDNVHQFEDKATLEHEAREWLVRMDGDEGLTATDKQALREWLSRSPAHRQELKRIAEFWDNSNVLTELYIPMHQVAKAQQRPASLLSLLAGFFVPSREGVLLSSRGSALLVMSFLLVAFALRGYIIPQPIDATNGIYAAAIGEIREQELVDGSVLQINTDSQVNVEYSEGTRKIHLLRGEAHFDVAHDKDWPFQVYAGKGVVKAVGTAFSVRLEEEKISVIVTEGKVDLVATPTIETQQTIGSLSKGQGASFTPTPEAKPRLMLVQKEINRQLSWREGYLVFEGEPLSQVVAELNRYLPLRIEIVDSALSDLPIGGRFKVGELEALFDVLETSFDVQVSRLDDQHVKLFQKTQKTQKNNKK